MLHPNNVRAGSGQFSTQWEPAALSSPQQPRAEVAIAGAMLCRQVPPAFSHISFGVLVAAHCELPGLITPASVLLGYGGAADTINATCSPHPDAVERKTHAFSWSWLSSQADASGQHRGPRSGPQQGCRDVKRDRLTHTLTSAP